MSMIKKTPLDVCFQSLDTPETYQNICCLGFLDKAVDEGELIKIVREQSSNYPKLNHALGNLDEKSLRSHHANVNECCRNLKSNSLTHYMEELYQEFKPDTPPWKIVYSNIPVEQNTFGFILSHALGDGVSGLDFFHSMDSNHVRSAQKPNKSEPKPRYLGALRSLIYEAVSKPNLFLINGTNSTKRELFLLNFPYHYLDKLKQENSTTAYAILLALVSYIVTDYCEIKGESHYVRPLLPVSIRGKNRPDDVSNKIGGATIKLNLGNQDPNDLIKDISKKLQQTLTQDAYYGYYLWAYILSKLSIRLRKKLLKISARKTSFICTNLVGPKHQIEIAGAKVEEQYVIPALMPEHGLGFGFMKSAGKMQIAIIYDPGIIKDGARLRKSLVGALEKIKLPKDFAIRESKIL